MEFSRNDVIIGIIMPNNWDESGRVIEIALYTYKEEVYAVEPNRLIQDLTNLIYKTVEIKGKIKVHADGHRSVAARNYILIEKFVDE